MRCADVCRWSVKSTFGYLARTYGSCLKLFQRGQTQLKDFEQADIPKAHTSLSMLCECSSQSWYIEFIHQLIQNLEPQYAMVDSSLQELGNIVRQLPMNVIIEPSQFGNPTDQFDQSGNHIIL